MRTVILLTALFACGSGMAQSNRFVHHDYEPYSRWFDQQTQAAQLYRGQATLHIFGHDAVVRAEPKRDAAAVARLVMGQPVTNIAYREQDPLPVDEINGYQDIWYHIRGSDEAGRPFVGYVWGAEIARGWRRADITGDGQAEFVLLGLAAQPRTAPSDIKGELRVLQAGRLVEQRLIPGLCLFEACGASPMLRILQDPGRPRLTVIEASTMTIGCDGGIEKAFYFWNGRHLDRIFHAEYLSQHIFTQKEFSFPAETTANGEVITRSICRYRQEDRNFNPVWECRTVPVAPQAVEPATAPAKVKARAR